METRLAPRAKGCIRPAFYMFCLDLKAATHEKFRYTDVVR